MGRGDRRQLVVAAQRLASTRIVRTPGSRPASKARSSARRMASTIVGAAMTASSAVWTPTVPLLAGAHRAAEGGAGALDDTWAVCGFRPPVDTPEREAHARHPIGDVGVVDGMMHIGDEAMFDALVEALSCGAPTRSSGSRAPRRRPPSATASGPWVASGSPAARRVQARFAVVLRCSSGERVLPADDPAWAVIEAVAGADAVVIAGGGNLASTWPLHVFERAALAAIAERRTAARRDGQTLGPGSIPPTASSSAGCCDPPDSWASASMRRRSWRASSGRSRSARGQPRRRDIPRVGDGDATAGDRGVRAR